MVIWIIDEEWNAYDVEISLLTKAFPGVMFRRSCYDFWHDLEEFGSTVDGLLAQVNVPLGDEVFSKMPRLKAISLYGTGYEAVDLDAAQKRGIGVRNVTAYSSEDIAEYVIMGTLFLVRRLPLFLKHNEKSPWGRARHSRPAAPPFRSYPRHCGIWSYWAQDSPKGQSHGHDRPSL